MDIELPQFKPLVEITQSSMNSFLACQQQFAFRYVYRLRNHGFSAPLSTGTAAHQAFDILLSPGEQPTAERLPTAMQAIDTTFEKLMSNASTLAISNETEILTSWAQARAVAAAWWVIHGEESLTWQHLHSELVCRAADNADLTSPLQYRMAGKLDGILQVAGSVRLREHKTMGSMRFVSPEMLTLDSQVLWYMLLAYYHLPDLALDGVLYDITIKPKHRLSLKAKNSVDELQGRMVEAMLSAPEKFFYVSTVDISQEQVAQAWACFQRIVAQMDAMALGNISRNTNSCGNYGGCAYRALCLAGADANDPEGLMNVPGIDNFQIGEAHAELESPESETEYDDE